MLPDTAKLTAAYDPNLLKGVTVITGRATSLTTDAAGKVLKTGQNFRLCAGMCGTPRQLTVAP